MGSSSGGNLVASRCACKQLEMLQGHSNCGNVQEMRDFRALQRAHSATHPETQRQAPLQDLSAVSFRCLQHHRLCHNRYCAAVQPWLKERISTITKTSWESAQLVGRGIVSLRVGLVRSHGPPDQTCVVEGGGQVALTWVGAPQLNRYPPRVAQPADEPVNEHTLHALWGHCSRDALMHYLSLLPVGSSSPTEAPAHHMHPVVGGGGGTWQSVHGRGRRKAQVGFDFARSAHGRGDAKLKSGLISHAQLMAEGDAKLKS